MIGVNAMPRGVDSTYSGPQTNKVYGFKISHIKPVAICTNDRCKSRREAKIWARHESSRREFFPMVKSPDGVECEYCKHAVFYLKRYNTIDGTTGR